jgi:hypothetical protein
LISEIDKREEGLTALASIIAKAYIQRQRQNLEQLTPALKDGEKQLVSEAEITKGIEPASLRHGCLYTETVRIETLLRRKPRVMKFRKK